MHEIGGQHRHLIVEPDSQTIRQYESVSDIEGHFSFKVENYYDTSFEDNKMSMAEWLKSGNKWSHWANSKEKKLRGVKIIKRITVPQKQMPVITRNPLETV